MRLQVKGDILIEYLQKKNSWTRETIDLIDWAGLEAALKPLPIQRRLKLTQMINNWQYTGRQKELFAQSTIANKVYHNDKLKQLEDEQIKNDAKCLFLCGECKTHMHAMECQSDKAKMKRRELIQRFKKTLEGVEVHDAIIRLLIWGIQWYPTKEVLTCILLEGSIDDVIQQAIKEQTRIGWCNLQRGYLSAK